ncbi:MAG: S-layer protein domain-containing protein, partial [Euryarchaeota archaeon]|nr:S-layer protein domain-containing protein [Euryarchaeota archaeon]
YTEGDVLIFSCYVPAVFRGTCASMVQIKDVFVIDDQFSGDYGFVLDDCRIDSWDLSEDYSIIAKDVALDGDKARIILLKNGAVIDEKLLTEESEAPVNSDCRYSYVKDGTEIINATLKAAFCGDILNAVELVEVHQRSEMGGSILINSESHLFKSVDITGTPWDLADGYVLTMKDVGFNDKVFLELSKNDAIMKETILNESSTFTYITDTGGINCVVDRVFCGCEANAVKLVNVNQYSDVNGTALLAHESYFYKTADPTILQWELLNGYVLTVKDFEEIHWCGGGNKVWLELSGDGSVLNEDILVSDESFIYETEIEIVSCTVDAVFRGKLGDMVKLRDVNQYSETGRKLIDHGSKTFATANPTGDIWSLCEGYSLDAKDVDPDGNKVWLALSKNGVVVTDAIANPGGWDDADSWFEYYNSTGALVFSAYVDAAYSSTDYDIVQLMYVTQYSDVNGSVLMMFGEEDKKTLHAGSATTILPSISAPLDGQIFVQGCAITFNASAADGTAPYTYTWYEDGIIVGTGNSFDAAFGTGSHLIALIVTDASGTNVSERVRVEIKSRGDVNQDGVITPIDAIIATRMAVRGNSDPLADVSGDGNVASLDALMILQAAAEMIVL